MAKKGSKKKTLPYELIDKKKDSPIYDLLDDIIASVGDHTALIDAKIVLAWALKWKEDKDGHMKLGMCKKISDLEKELAKWDFIILLNRPYWNAFNDEQQRALLDHELCHAAPLIDEKTGEQKEDERGRKVWRIRKHDIEEFGGVVERNGLYKRDLEAFAQGCGETRRTISLR